MLVQFVNISAAALRIASLVAMDEMALVDQLAVANAKIAEMQDTQGVYNMHNAQAVTEHTRELAMLQEKSAQQDKAQADMKEQYEFEKKLSKKSQGLHVVAHAAIKKRAARYNLLTSRLLYVGGMLHQYEVLTPDQRASVLEHVESALNGCSVMLTSCTLMDEPNYEKNEALALHLMESYVHNLFGAATRIPMDPKYAGINFLELDPKIEKKLVEKAPADLVGKTATKEAVVQPAVAQPYMAPFPPQYYPQLPPPHYAPPPPYHQLQQQDAGRGGWNNKRARQQ